MGWRDAVWQAVQRGNMDFSRLERAAIEAILSKSVDGMEVLRQQFAAASVLKRDYTGVGFYTTISVPTSMPAMPNTWELREALFRGAIARAKSDPEGWVLFHLSDDGGYLACLEGCTVADSWPDEDEIEDFGACGVRRDVSVQPSVDHLIPDCDNAFTVWRMNTSAKTLLVTSLRALAIAMFVAIIAMVLIAIAM
jgi:hypothetical protein